MPPSLSRRNAIVALALAPCAAAPRAAAAAPLKIVASFSIIADLVRQIAGPRAQVTTLVGPGQDAHAFQPRPSDAQAIAAADLFVVNGLGFDAWAERLAKAAGARRPIVVAATAVRGRRVGPSHAMVDPHAWQDAANAKLYVAAIRDRLAAADPDGATQHAAAAAALLTRLDALDADIRTSLQPIPRGERKIVTSHDAFGYYGAAYGVDFLAPLGLAGDAEPSARALAGLIAQIRRERIRALFLEKIVRSSLLEQIARETGVRIGGTLYSDALSPADGPAATYEAMMRHNTAMIAAALARGIG